MTFPFPYRNSAYFGLFEICQIKPGKTIAISGAGGAVGSLAGQIAKLTGLRVIGFAGSDEKCNQLVKEFGFDATINYKTADVDQELATKVPEGIDFYFDNVGGIVSYHVWTRMNMNGRIAVCGSISAYNEDYNQMPRGDQSLSGESFRVQ